MKKSKIVSRFLATLLAVSITFGLMLSSMPMAAAAEGENQGTMEASKETVLKEMKFPTNSPTVDPNDKSNPYGPGTAALQTYDELFINYTSIADKKAYYAAFDSDYNNKTGATTGYALQMERFQIAPTKTGTYAKEMTYSMVYGGDFDGDGRANEVAQFYMYGDMYKGNYELRIISGDTTTADSLELVAPVVVSGYDFGTNKANRVDPWEITSFLAGAVGDFDGDGIDEIAVYNLKGLNNKGCISIYKVVNGSLSKMQDIAFPTGARDNSSAGDSKHKYLAVSLAAGSLNQKTDEIDDLVVMISYHKESLGSEDKDALNAGSQMVIYHGGQKTGGPLKQISHIRGKLNNGNYKGIYFLNNGETLILRYASASIGDINGDGLNEIVVGGFCSYSGNGHWSLHKYNGEGVEPYMIITYFKADGTHPQGQDDGVYNSGFSKARASRWFMHVYDSDLCDAPIALTTFKADGDGEQESVFMGGKVFKYDGAKDFKQDNDANDAVTYTFTGAEDVESISNTWYSQAVAGNFNSNPQGVESVMYVQGTKVSGKESYYFQIGTVTKQPRDETYGNYAKAKGAWTATWNPHIYKEKRGNLSVAAVDIDNDSLLVRFVEKSYYFSNPNVVAVMQAAPHFAELEVLESGYISRGSTEFTKSSGSETTHNQAVTVSAGVVVGVENEANFFGMFGSGGDIESTVTGSVGYAYEGNLSKTNSVTFTSASDTDRVALVMTPYTKYEYDMYVPTYSIITQKEYDDNKAEIATLEAELEGISIDDEEYKERALRIFELTEACKAADEAVRKGYKLGQVVDGAWTRFSLSIPREVCTTIITVDKYDEIASQFSDMSTIRGNILPANYEVGNPGSYRDKEPDLEDTEIEVGENTVSQGQGSWFMASNAGDGSIEATIENTQSDSHGITWGVEMSTTVIAKIASVKAGITTSISYEGGFSWTETAGTSITGTVGSLPDDKEAEKYSFYWQFIGYITKLDNKECQVLEYLVKNVEAPPSPPSYFEATASTKNSVTLEWTPGPRLAETYKLYRYHEGVLLPLATVDGQTTSYVDTGRAEDTTYKYAITAVRGNNESVRTEITERTTLTAHGAPEVTVTGPTSARTNSIIVLTASYTGVTGGQETTFTWQKRDPSLTLAWSNVSTGAAGNTLSVYADTNGEQYRCVVNQSVSGILVNGYSNHFTLNVGKGGTNTTLSLSKDSGKANGTKTEESSKTGTFSRELTATVTGDATGTLYDIVQYSSGYYLRDSSKLYKVTDEAVITAIDTAKGSSDEPVNDADVTISALPADPIAAGDRFVFGSGITSTLSTKSFSGTATQSVLGSIQCTSYRTVSELVSSQTLYAYEATFETTTAPEEGGAPVTTSYIRYYTQIGSEGIVPADIETIYDISGTIVTANSLLPVTRSWSGTATVIEVTKVDGEAITLTATVEEAVESAPTVPTGRVRFEIVNASDNTSKQYIDKDLTAGINQATAAASWTAPAAGIYYITAIYSGDTTLNPSSSASRTFSASSNDSSAVKVLQISAPDKLTYGETLESKLTVSLFNGSTTSAITPTSIEIYDGQNVKVATSLEAVLTPGSYRVVVGYASGDDPLAARHTLVVDKKAITVKAVDMTHDLGAGDANGFNRAAASGEVSLVTGSALVSGDSLNPADFNISCTPLQVKGSYDIVLTAGESAAAFLAKYAVTYQNGSFAVSQSEDTVTFSAGANGALTGAYGSSGLAFASGGGVPSGALLTFTAVPSNGYIVEKWTVGSEVYTETDSTAGITISGNTLTVTAANNLSVSVSFKLDSVPMGAITWQAPTNGTMTVTSGGAALTSGAELALGTVDITVTLTPNKGYIVSSLNSYVLTAVAGSDAKTAGITNLTGDLALVPVFTALQTQQISFSIDNGTMSAAASRNSLTAYAAAFNASPATVYEGGEVVFTAVPTTDYSITGWLVNGVAYPAGGTDDTLTLSWAEASTVTSVAVTTAYNTVPDGSVVFANPTNGTLSAAISEMPLTSGETPNDSCTIVFTAVPSSSNYVITDWLVDGQSQGVTTDTFSYSYVKDTGVRVSVQIQGVPLSITVAAGTGGTATGTPSSVRYGDSLTLAATAADGYTFDHWDKDGTSVSTSASYSAGTQTADAVYTAIFAEVIDDCEVVIVTPSNGAITVTAGGVAVNSGDRVPHGTTLRVTAIAAGGYVFDGWSGSLAGRSGSVQDVLIGQTDTNLVFAAGFRFVDSNPIFPTEPDNSGSTGGSTGSEPAQIVTAGDGSVGVGYTQSGQQVTLDLTGEKMDEILDSANDVITLDVSGVDGAEEVVISETALEALAGTEMPVEIKLPEGTVSLDPEAAASLAGQAGGDVSVQITSYDKSELNSRQQAAAGDKPVYDISIMSGGDSITSFDGGQITVTLHYELREGENPNGIIVYYIDQNGNLEEMLTEYNPVTQTVSFKTTHLSLYTIAYDLIAAWKNPFSDISRDLWFYSDVAYTVQTGLFAGTGETTFSPQLSMSRAMLVTVLWRMEGQPAATTGSIYTDTVAGSWYDEAVRWASETGLVGGYGDGRFGPDDNVTREQVATILLRYASSKEITLPKTTDAIAFNDEEAIEEYAIEAVRAVQSAGIVTGKTGNVFDPKGIATRAEVSAMLRRFADSVK